MCRCLLAQRISPPPLAVNSLPVLRLSLPSFSPILFLENKLSLLVPSPSTTQMAGLYFGQREDKLAQASFLKSTSPALNLTNPPFLPLSKSCVVPPPPPSSTPARNIFKASFPLSSLCFSIPLSAFSFFLLAVYYPTSRLAAFPCLFFMSVLWRLIAPCTLGCSFFYASPSSISSFFCFSSVLSPFPMFRSEVLSFPISVDVALRAFPLFLFCLLLCSLQSLACRKDSLLFSILLTPFRGSPSCQSPLSFTFTCRRFIFAVFCFWSESSLFFHEVSRVLVPLLSSFFPFLAS